MIYYSFSTLLFQTGMLKLSDEELFIQPLEKSRAESSSPQAHAIYRRHASPSPSLPLVQQVSGQQAHQGTCGVQSTKKQKTQSTKPITNQKRTLFCRQPLEIPHAAPFQRETEVKVSSLQIAEGARSCRSCHPSAVWQSKVKV